MTDRERDVLESALGTRYKIVRLLGRGGMGAVYLAHETDLDREVAIKVLPANAAGNPETRERFRREARTAAKLAHPNIVPLHTFGDADGVLYFVMGYVRGESLAARLDREGRMPEAEVRRILGALADALDVAHRAGVVHRDIKPDNVLLDADTGRPMLTDFGIAKATGANRTLTEVGAIVGTPHYMSPEQATGERTLDGRSDLYSLAVMGYQMAAGRLPFSGESIRELIVQHVAEEPAPLESAAPGIPADLAAAITRCLRKDPAQRFANAGDFRAAVGESADDDAFLPAELGNLTRFNPWKLATWVSLAATMGVAAWATAATKYGPILAMVATMYAAADVVAFVGVRLSARRKGHSKTVIDAFQLRPPRGWRHWWPESWRRAGDVWTRLPRAARVGRALEGWACAIALVFVWTALMSFRPAYAPKIPMAIVMAVEALLGAVLGMAGMQTTFRAIRGDRLSVEEARAAYRRSTFDPPFWRQPRFASLLTAPVDGRATTAEPRSLAEYLREIEAAANRITDPLSDVAVEGVDAAKQLAKIIGAMDVEIAQLARDAQPADLAQVRQKLSALGDPAEDTEARRKMRDLLAGQEELLLGLAEQLDSVARRRSTLLTLLRNLWLQLAAVRAEMASAALDATETTGKIRALLQEIEAYAGAAATVRLTLSADRSFEPRSSREGLDV